MLHRLATIRQGGCLGLSRCVETSTHFHVASTTDSLDCSQHYVLTHFHIPHSTALQALALQAQYESGGDQDSIIPQLQSMLGDGVDPSTQLIATHVFLKAGMKKEALQCVHQGDTLEQLAVTLQLYLQLDRLDLAKKQLQMLRQADEDSILCHLGAVYIALATGSSAAQDALHSLQQLSEQYGPSILLLNLTACAHLQAGQYAQAESKLEQARQELGATDADTLVNLIVACQYQQKPTAALVQSLKASHPTHFLSKGLEMVEGAFERESLKYQVAA
jgi:coatomer protein complex subunit epsilon